MVVGVRLNTGSSGAPVAAAVSSGSVVSTEGRVVQVVQTLYDTLVVGSGTDAFPVDNAIDGSGYVVGLVPTSVNSRIHLSFVAHVGVQANERFGLALYRKVGAGGAWTHVAASELAIVFDNRKSSQWMARIAGAFNDTTGSAQELSNVQGQFTDTPADATNMHYYTVYWARRAVSVYGYSLNRSHTESTDMDHPLAVSSATAREIYYAPTV